MGTTFTKSTTAPVKTAITEMPVINLPGPAYAYFTDERNEGPVFVRVNMLIAAIRVREAKLAAAKTPLRDNEENIAFSTFFKLIKVDATGFDRALLKETFVISQEMRMLLKPKKIAKAIDDSQSETSERSEKSSSTATHSIVSNQDHSRSYSAKANLVVEKANGRSKTQKVLGRMLSPFRLNVINNLSALLTTDTIEASDRIILDLVCALLTEAMTDAVKTTRTVISDKLAQLGVVDEMLTQRINACFPSTAATLLSPTFSDRSTIISTVDKIKCQALLAIIFSEKANYLCSFDSVVSPSLDLDFSRQMKDACETKLTQLMQAVLTPLCIATIEALRESSSASDTGTNPLLRYTLMCQLITKSVIDRKKVATILAENDATSEFKASVAARAGEGLDQLLTEPSQQDQKDFMLCFSYVIHELPRYLLQASSAVTSAQLLKISKKHIDYAQALYNAEKSVTLAALEEGDESALDTPVKMRK